MMNEVAFFAGLTATLDLMGTDERVLYHAIDRRVRDSNAE